jgi:hypothetical protein
LKTSKKKTKPKNYSKEDIENMLQDYIRIDDIDEIPVNSQIHYVTLDSNKRQVFRIGGRLVSTTKNLVCLSRGMFKWYVKKQHFENKNDKEPLFETIFWKKRDYMDDLLDHIEYQNNEISLLKEQISMIKEILKILKDDNKINKDAIEILKKQVLKCRELCLSIKERKRSSKIRR